jgi:energy-coupling factor transporter ATP-binding protein EcfA2
MRLERLTLANFRGFEHIDLEFESDITVVAGVNGVGKSGVLKALTVAMSQALPSMSACKDAPLGLSDSDVQFGKPALALSVSLALPGAAVRVDVNRTAPLDPAKAEALIRRRDELRFATRETKKGSNEERVLNDDLRLIEHQLAGAADLPTVRVLPSDAAVSPDAYIAAARAAVSQPIAVYYSTARLLSRLPPTLPRVRALDVSFANAKALSQLEVSLNDFANWARVVAAQKNKDPALRMFRQLSRAIRNFLPGVTRLRLHDERPPRFSVQKQGSRLFLEQLSDGERGLLALVFDLTRRLAIANPRSANPLREGVALVMIDEIELHLHPKWQRDVVKRLRETFGACQFVVTTHSPLVLGEVAARCVRFLEFRDGKVVKTVPTEAYGMDANRILQEFMGAPVRNRQVDADLRVLFELIDKEHLTEARAAIARLETTLGPDEPELTRASSLIRFLEGGE